MTQIANTQHPKASNPWAIYIRKAAKDDLAAQELTVRCLFCEWERTGPAVRYRDPSGHERHGVLYWQNRHAGSCKRRRERWLKK